MESVTVPNFPELSYIIPCYFDQENTESLDALLRIYSGYPPEVIERIEFVIVDDASPIPVQIPADIDLNLRLLRIREDIAWNQGGARNLGVLYSRCDKILATDLDHLFSAATLAHILALPRLGRRMYRFRRKGQGGELIKPHPNSFVMSRGRFLELFGVDEEFSGHYGCEDGMFWRWQRYNGTRFSFFPQRYASQLRDYDRKRSDHSLDRDATYNIEMKHRKIREWEIWGARGGHSRRFLEFTWDLVADRQRQQRNWQPQPDRLWKKLWLWRLLWG